MNKAKVTRSSLSHLVDMRVFSRSVIGEEFIERNPVSTIFAVLIPVWSKFSTMGSLARSEGVRQAIPRISFDADQAD